MRYLNITLGEFVHRFGMTNSGSILNQTSPKEFPDKFCIIDISKKFEEGKNEKGIFEDYRIKISENDAKQLGMSIYEIADRFKEQEGIVDVNGVLVKVSYTFINEEEIVCTVVEAIGSYYVGYKFTTHYKSLKIMKEFIIGMREHTYGEIRIKAKSMEEAIQKVKDNPNNIKLIPQPDTFQIDYVNCREIIDGVDPNE